MLRISYSVTRGLLLRDARLPNGRRAGVQCKPRWFEWGVNGRSMEDAFVLIWSIRLQRAGGQVNDAHILLSDAWPCDEGRVGLQWTPPSFEWGLLGRTMEENAILFQFIGN